MSYIKTLAITILMLTGFAFSSNTIADAPQKHSLIKIYVTGESDAQKMMKEGLFIDHAESHGEYIESWLSAEEIEMLARSGVRYEVAIDDFESYYRSLPQMTPAEMELAIQRSASEFNVTHSIYGTMGGYLTFDQVIDKLDSIKAEYPGLISDRFSIGTTIESRDMWTVRVSNNPEVTTGRPEVWIHSMIHAREPMSMQQSIYFIYWLLENYNIDPIATYILSNRELYFTPVFNPDGYEYNRSTNPNGGGMWRKNRKLNSGTTYGVDLNRNFGVYSFWNSTNNGSSTVASSETYRGLSPFSEPETRNAMNFVNSRNFKSIMSYHTYGNYLIRPWGYVDAPTPHEAVFQGLSEDMALHNHYTLGRSNQTVAYGVRGVTDDWYYNDSGHASAIAITPEVGTSADGFWPPQSRILPLAQLTLKQNIYVAMTGGPYVCPVKSVLNKEYYSPGESGSLKVYLKNKGLMNASNVKVELTCANPLLTIQTGTFSYPSVASMSKDSLTFNFTIDGASGLNIGFKAVLTFKQDNTNIVYTENIYIPVGSGNIIFLDSAENGTSKWTISGGWGITSSQSYSPSNSFADSPTGNYTSSTNRTLTLTTALNISATPVLMLSYYYKHTIDTLDNAYIDISSNNGATWESVKFYNKTVSAWTKEVLDISNYAEGTTQLKIRFSMVSNGTIVSDGIYIDNIKLVGYNATPTDISTGSNGIPEKFSLSQNYPNPFNPKTVINYEIAKAGNVDLKVFDMLGKEIITLVSEIKNPGSYSVSFDASTLSSGLYYYKITSGDFSDTKKMLLVK